MPRGTLLIVDDDPNVARVIGLRLKLNGYEAISATDGATAVGMAIERLPDAIILDRQLGREDGLSVLAALQQQPTTKDIPVLLVSGEEIEADDVIRAGATGFLMKPFCGNELVEKINQLTEAGCTSKG